MARPKRAAPHSPRIVVGVLVAFFLVAVWIFRARSGQGGGGSGAALLQNEVRSGLDGNLEEDGNGAGAGDDLPGKTGDGGGEEQVKDVEISSKEVVDDDGDGKDAEKSVEENDRERESSSKKDGDGKDGGQDQPTEDPKEIREVDDVEAESSRGAGQEKSSSGSIAWKLRSGDAAQDYIPCLDNEEAIKMLPSRHHFEHRERHCPSHQDLVSCLVPIPKGYKRPVPWPQSREEIWFDNVPHPGLVTYKKDQTWVKKTGNKLTFPGTGTQFILGADHYINYIEKTLPDIEWGKHARVVLDVGCGVASFGGYLFRKDVVTMSFAPKDELRNRAAMAEIVKSSSLPGMVEMDDVPFSDRESEEK